MRLHNLPKLKGKTRARKRVGRGYGSGKGGHTAGRGSKGQKARGKVKLEFEGGQLPLVKRLPHKRGFKRTSKRYKAVNVSRLNIFEEGSVVDEKALLEKGLIASLSKKGVKILGLGELTKKISLKKGIKYSKNAKIKIEKVGGTVE